MNPAAPAAVAAVLTVIVGLACLAGCTSSSASANSAATLNRLRGMDILTTPPTHGRLLGHGEDRGSNSGITGRSPGITNVFATTVFPRAIEAYYQSVYRKYRLSEDCCATAHNIQLVGASPTATIGIDITTGQPHLPDHFAIHPRAAPPGATTWATVQVTARH